MDEFSLGLTDTEWRKVGEYANSLIQNDMTAGKFQNGKSNLQYLSEQYKKYKAAGFKHLKYKQSLANPETGGLIRSKEKLRVRNKKVGGGQSFRTERQLVGQKKTLEYGGENNRFHQYCFCRHDFNRRTQEELKSR